MPVRDGSVKRQAVFLPREAPAYLESIDFRLAVARDVHDAVAAFLEQAQKILAEVFRVVEYRVGREEPCRARRVVEHPPELVRAHDHWRADIQIAQSAVVEIG